ncbi:MAG: radical SAM protein [Planctomycetes bacterium]|nr:radical SAM protein [Planctomycetota bacterium]MCB9918028.1 radical SAM protein [Planctomycetota bacterium]
MKHRQHAQHSIRCTCPWDSLTVWVDGSVSHCGRSIPLGELRTVDFETFWNSVELQRVRGMFRHDALVQSGCMPTCNVLMALYPDRYVPNQIETAAMAPVPDTAIRLERTKHRPSYMLLQLSDFCSLGCPMCCYGAGDDLKAKLAKSKVLPNEVFDHLLPVWPGIRTLELLGGELFDLPWDGHPLRRLFTDLKNHAHPSLDVKVVTNGKNLDERWCRFLLDHAFVGCVSFSIDSAHPEIYPTIRRRGNLARTLENLERLASMRQTHYRPEIHVTSLLGNHTAPTLLHLAETARRLGADRLDIQPMNPMGDPRFHYDNNIFQPRFVPELVALWKDLTTLDFHSNRADILVMIEAFVGFLGMSDEVVAQDSSLPQFGQYRGDLTLGPIARRNEVVQSFVAKRTTLRRARLQFATYARTNTKPIDLMIETGTSERLLRVRIDPRELVDNAWHDVELPNTKLQLGREYRVRLASRRSGGNDCVTMRGATSETTQVRVGRRKLAASIAMMLF